MLTGINVAWGVYKRTKAKGFDNRRTFGRRVCVKAQIFNEPITISNLSRQQCFKFRKQGNIEKFFSQLPRERKQSKQR